MEKKTAISLPAILTVMAFVLAFGACVKTNDPNATCTNRVESQVLKVEGADTGLVNQDVPLKVTYVILNSCGKYGGIYPATATQTTNVHIFADYVGCVCTQVAFQTTQDYKFNSPNAGTFTLSFWSGDNNIISKKIVIR
jgi:hypothetical protein